MKSQGADTLRREIGKEVIMERITRKLHLCIPAAVLMISLAAEYYYCFEGWLTDPGSSYVFMILCVAVQTACIEFVCFSLGVGHRVVVMLAASLGTGAVFSAMLWWNLYISMSNEMLNSAMLFNMLPLVTGAVLLAFQMMFTGFSGRMKLKGVQ